MLVKGTSNPFPMFIGRSRNFFASDKTHLKMDKKTVLIIGLEKQDVQAIKQQVGLGFIILHYEMLPKIKLVSGTLFVESLSVTDKYLPVDQVIFHGIFEDDFDVLTMLTLWNGPCLPNAQGMMEWQVLI